jgi:hypothetical protein
VPAGTATQISHLPPVATLFAAFLGYNPMQQLLGPSTLGALPPSNAQTLTGREFFPHLISGPFHDGLMVVFWLAIVMAVVGAVASALPTKAAAAEQEAARRARRRPRSGPHAGQGGVQPARRGWGR